MGITKSKGHKEINDKFYTNPNTAKDCICLLDLSQYDVIIEPSAGNGSFSKQIPGCLAYDLIPEDDSIIKQDFFDFNSDSVYGKKVLTIGNPPFGVQNNIAVKFFNKAAEYSDTIAFILPKTFMKSSIQNKLNPWFHLEKNIDLPFDSFILNGQPYGVKCVFQIWKKKNVKRVVNKIKIDNSVIEFCDKSHFDFIVRRVGGNCGMAYIDDGKNVSSQSNYFIKNHTDFSNNELINIINSVNKNIIDYSVGPRSISKGELINYIIEGMKTARQQNGFNFEKAVEYIFKNIKCNTGHKDEFDGILNYKGNIYNCQIKHSDSDRKSTVELADLKRNSDKKDNYILINGIDDNNISDNITIHYKDYNEIINGLQDSKIKDIYVYDINPNNLNIDYSPIDELHSRIVDNKFTTYMNLDSGLCDYTDKFIFKHGKETSEKTIMNVLMNHNILSRYNFYENVNPDYYNTNLGFVIYEPKPGYITHIPVDKLGNVYSNIEDLPEFYDVILKIDHTNLTDDNWNILRKYIQKSFSDKNEIVTINPKRDHKNQFRFQCSVKKGFIEQYLCEYDKDKFELNTHLNNILSFDDYNKEIPLW